MNAQKKIVVVIVPKESKETNRRWRDLLMFWLFVRAMRPPLEQEVKLLRTLVVVTMLLLVVLSLVAVGATDVIAEVLKAWPSVP